ncbi:hypothetical protein [Weissella confusa]|uniref:hypothetical protein n=1 Tax=Weissella confusa TaxID=1583 RepID=UPI00107F6EF7|nr:hypothetical protein [Weissella confusa]MBD5833076.1 hypothetical protein [Weissella confusa]MBJ7631361.1 hypothetical protein [Weissella confusa]MBJ7635527.1 hypothetical protein [Weissella confusa]MCT0009755.1 hypothetical protein [Weissella confusa]MDY2521171.1 hypothetical protein [Weissella confusa]
MISGFKEKSITFGVGLIVLGMTIKFGATVTESAFWTALATGLFWGLWTISDWIKESERFETDTNNSLGELKSSIKDLNKKINDVTVQVQVQEKNYDNMTQLALGGNDNPVLAKVAKKNHASITVKDTNLDHGE